MSTNQAFQSQVDAGLFDGLKVPPRVVVLPWPPTILSPNARPHWAPKAKAIKEARSTAFYLTREAFGAVKPKWSGARLSVTFNPPSRRGFDKDNLTGRLKAAQDGIADALGIDDQFFVPTYAFGPVVKGGSVRVEIRGIRE